MDKNKKNTEQIAINYVKKYEKKQGRESENVSKTRCGYDIRSGRRCIEVKGHTKPHIPSFITIHNSITRSLGRKVKDYYVYIVYDYRDPKLIIIPPSVIFSNLEIESHFLIRPIRIIKEQKKLIKQVKLKK